MEEMLQLQRILGCKIDQNLYKTPSEYFDSMRDAQEKRELIDEFEKYPKFKEQEFLQQIVNSHKECLASGGAGILISSNDHIRTQPLDKDKLTLVERAFFFAFDPNNPEQTVLNDEEQQKWKQQHFQINKKHPGSPSPNKQAYSQLLLEDNQHYPATALLSYQQGMGEPEKKVKTNDSETLNNNNNKTSSKRNHCIEGCRQPGGEWVMCGDTGGLCRRSEWYHQECLNLDALVQKKINEDKSYKWYCSEECELYAKQIMEKQPVLSKGTGKQNRTNNAKKKNRKQ